jgi:UPF0755 protein
MSMMHYSLKSGQPLLKRLVSLLATVIIVASLILAVVARTMYTSALRPVGTSKEFQQIVIPSGTSVKAIATLLVDAKLIRAAWAFEWYVRFHEGNDALQAGTYPLAASQSVQEIVSVLTNGKVRTDTVTILPGKRLDQIKAMLINNGFNEQEVEAALQPERYADHPVLSDKPAGASLEGYLFPESFQKTDGTRPEEIVKSALDEMQKVLTAEVRAGMARQGLSVHQGIILASIVYQEAGSAEDMPTIAQVFLRRISIGMQLGSDVTALYGAIQDDVDLPENSAAAANIAIAHDSPYNTRMHNGLPPGPISNANRAALQAVANPATSDYLFFVAGDPDSDGNPGKTHFARTVEEHEANVRNYCKILC